jgi:DNA-binding PucR family transcriptional regulator
VATAALVIWTIGLAGAAAASVAVLESSRLLIVTLRDLVTVTRAIADAAHGIHRHVSIVRTLPDLRPAARQLADAASAAGQSAGRLEQPPGAR